MALKIRLSRGGRKDQAFYRIVVAENTSPRDGKFKEKIGYYNPLAREGSSIKKVSFDEERVKYWISVGAKMTDKVAKLLSKEGLVEAEKFKDKYEKTEFDGMSKKAVKEEKEKRQAQAKADAEERKKAKEEKLKAEEEAKAKESAVEEAPAEA
jgi:small subunit ribosomal protein S16